MAYNALYRKYRPSKFSEISGQNIIVDTIKKSIKYDKISHAYLFSGPRGTGKTSIAKLIGKSVNCLNLQDGESCGSCQICKQIINKEYSDIIEIDAASNNGVDEIREIKNKVNLVPTNGRYKIYIIDEVHMLSIGAFNALLKTLEEPPKHIIFILATTEPHKVPDTIISRCQCFEFKKIAVKDIISKLEYICKKENIIIEDEALEEIAILSKGGMRDSIGMLDQLASYNEKISLDDVHEVNGTISYLQLVDFLNDVNDNNIIKILEFINCLDEKGKDIFKVTEEILIFLRDILLYMKVPNYFPGNKKNRFKNINDEINEKDILNYIKEINSVLSEMKYSNNPKILLEMLFLKNMKNDFLFDERKTIKVNENNICLEVENKKINVEKNSEESNVILKNNITLEVKKEKINVEKNSEESNVVFKNNIDEKKEITKVVDCDNNLNNKDKIYCEKRIEELKKIRINNTLALANKNIKLKINEKWNNINNYTLDHNYGAFAVLLLDGIVQVASEEYMIITYPYKSTVNRANHSISKIEEFLKKIIGKPFKFIALTYEEWVKIKDEYITRIRKGEKYEVIDEKIEIVKIIDNYEKKNKDSKSLQIINKLFDDKLIEIK